MGVAGGRAWNCTFGDARGLLSASGRQKKLLLRDGQWPQLQTFSSIVSVRKKCPDGAQSWQTRESLSTVGTTGVEPFRETGLQDGKGGSLRVRGGACDKPWLVPRPVLMAQVSRD